MRKSGYRRCQLRRAARTTSSAARWRMVARWIQAEKRSALAAVSALSRSRLKRGTAMIVSTDLHKINYDHMLVVTFTTPETSIHHITHIATAAHSHCEHQTTTTATAILRARARTPFGGGDGMSNCSARAFKFVVLHLVAQKPARTGYRIIRRAERARRRRLLAEPVPTSPKQVKAPRRQWPQITDHRGHRQLTGAAGRSRVACGLPHPGRLRVARTYPPRSEVMRAMENLKPLHLAQRQTPEQEIARRVLGVIDRAAVEIRQL